MINEIVIKIDDSGNYVVKGTMPIITDNKIDMLRWVSEFCKELGYFPTHKNDLIINPISIEEFLKQKKKEKR